MEVRGQLVGIRSPSTVWVLGIELGLQGFLQMSLPTKPSYWFQLFGGAGVGGWLSECFSKWTESQTGSSSLGKLGRCVLLF